MLVSICTPKESILSNLVTMVANNGCKFKQIRKYDAQLIKGTDICILDLDNIKEYHATIKKDINILQEVLIIGISSSDNLLNDFSPILNTVKKPFNSKQFISFKEQIKKELNSNYTINKDIDIIYNNLGIKKNDLFDDGNLNNEKLIKALKKQTKDISSLKKEKDFFSDLNIENIFIPKPKIQELPVVREQNNLVYEDKALEKYRFYKLKRLNLTKTEIDKKLQKLAEFKAKEDAIRRQEQRNFSRNNLLEKLKSGNLVNKTTKQETNIKITKEDDVNFNELTPEEIYKINKLKNEEKENNVKNKQNLHSNEKPIIPEENKSNIKAETKKEEPKSEVNIKPENNTIYKPNRIENDENQKPKIQKENKIPEIKNEPKTSKVSSPIANTEKLDASLYKTKRPAIEEKIEKQEQEQKQKKKSYNHILELEKQKEEELNKKNTTTILDLNLSTEQQNEIKEKLQNLRKYKKAPPPPPISIQIENEENNDIVNEENNDIVNEEISENTKNNSSKKEDTTNEEIKNTLADIKNEIKEEVLKIKDEIKEEVGKIKEEVSKTKEESEELTQNQKLYNAIHRLDGSNYSNKTTLKNNNNDNNIKDIKAELPSTSLFDLIKDKNKDIEIVDKKELRKNEINRIVKPPKR